MFKSSFQSSLFVALASQPDVSMTESSPEIFGELRVAVFSCAEDLAMSMILLCAAQRAEKGSMDELEAKFIFDCSGAQFYL